MRRVWVLIKIIAGLGIITVLLAGVFVVSPMLYNNFLFEKYFMDIDRNMKKAGIKVLHYEKNLGLLQCCSNHLDMEILAAFNSDKTVEELYHILEKTDIISPFRNTNSFTLYKMTGGNAMIYENNRLTEIEEDNTDDKEYKERVNKAMREHASGYLVGYGDQAYSGFSMWDYRAH